MTVGSDFLLDDEREWLADAATVLADDGVIAALCQRLAEARSEAAGLRAVHTVQSDIIVAVTAERDAALVLVDRKQAERVAALAQVRSRDEAISAVYRQEHQALIERDEARAAVADLVSVLRGARRIMVVTLSSSQLYELEAVDAALAKYRSAP